MNPVTCASMSNWSSTSVRAATTLSLALLRALCGVPVRSDEGSGSVYVTSPPSNSCSTRCGASEPLVVVDLLTTSLPTAYSAGGNERASDDAASSCWYASSSSTTASASSFASSATSGDSKASGPAGSARKMRRERCHQ